MQMHTSLRVRTRIIVLAASSAFATQALASLGEVQSTPTAPAPTAPARDDLLKGPKVPPLDVQSDRPFVGGAKGGSKGGTSDRQSRPVLEQRVYFLSIDQMGFDRALVEKIDVARVAFVDRLAAYEKSSAARRKELELARKASPSNQPPSPEFRKAMEELDAARPKLAEVRAEVAKLLTAEQAEALEKKYADEMKRVRAELTRRTDEERAKKKAAADKARKQKGSDVLMEDGEMGGDSPAKPG